MRRLWALVAAATLAAGAARGACLVDDFSTDPFAGRWDNTNPAKITWDSVNEEVDYAGDASSDKITYATAVGGDTSHRWAQVKIGGSSFTSNSVLLRKNGTGKGTGVLWYEVEVYSVGNRVYWYHCDAGSCLTLQSSTTSASWGPGRWYAVEIVGTGTSVQAKIWDCGTAAPCGTVDDPSTWGTPTTVLSSPSFGTRTPIDNGEYVGLGWITNNPGSTTHIHAGGTGCSSGGGSTPRRVILVTKTLQRIVPAQMDDAWFDSLSR